MSATPTAAPARPSFAALFTSLAPAVRKNLIVLFCTQGFSTATITVSTTLSSIIMVNITGAETLSGLPATINFFVSAFAALWAGRVMAARGRRFGLAIGFLIGAIGATLGAVAALEKNLPGFLLGGALVGVANSVGNQARYAAGEMVVSAVRGRVMGSLLTGSVVGTVAAYLLTLLVRMLASGLAIPPIELGWFMGAAFMLVSALMIWTLLFPDPSSLAVRDTPQTISSAQPVRSWASLWAHPGIRLAVLSMMFGQGLMVMLMVLTPLHANHLGLDAPKFVTIHIVGMFGFAWLTGQLADAWGRKTVMMLGAAQIMLAGFVAYFATRELEIGFSMFVLGTGWNFMNVAGSAMLTDFLEPHERARVQGNAELFVWLAAATGALGGGVIVGNYGFPVIGVVAMILSGAALVVALTTRLERPALT